MFKINIKKKIRKIVAVASAVTLVSGTLSGLGFVTNGQQNAQAATYTWTGEVKQTINGITWVISGKFAYNNYYEISKISCTFDGDLSGKEVVVPDQIEGTFVGTGVSTGITLGTFQIPITQISAGIFGGTKIKSISLGKNVTTINSEAFLNCKNLVSVKTRGTQEISVDDFAFVGCNQLETFTPIAKNIGVQSFLGTKIQEISISGDNVKIGTAAFENVGLSKINFVSTGNSITIAAQAFRNTLLSELEIPYDEIVVDGYAFSNCSNLSHLIFDGDVSYLSENPHPIFSNSFNEEYDANGNIIEKSVIFRGKAELDAKNYSKEEAGYHFKDCTGLKMVKFEGVSYLGNYSFYNCINLDEVDFCDDAYLGNQLFVGCKKLTSLSLIGSVEPITGKVYDRNIQNAEINPFDNSSIESLYFTSKTNASDTVFVNINGVDKIYYDVKRVAGSVKNAKQLVFKNPDTEFRFVYGFTSYGAPNYGQFFDDITSIHDVVGYSSKTTTLRDVENLIADNSYAKFQNYVYADSIIVPDITIINTISKDDIIEKIKNIEVTYAPYDDISNKLKVGYSEVSDREGFIIDTDTLPDTLSSGGTYNYYVYYSGRTALGKVNVIQKSPEGISVNWNKNSISKLVANQKISLADIVEENDGIAGTIYYNDGTYKNLSKSEVVNSLKLNINEVVLGNNTIIISYQENDVEVKDAYQCVVNENSIASIQASYSETLVYEGDNIDIDKISITPTYVYDEDTTVPRNLKPTSIYPNTVTSSGAITVYYNDIQCILQLKPISVVATKVYAGFDNNYNYIQGQQIDPKFIKVNAEFNNGSTINDIDSSEYTVNIKLETDTYIMATVTYKGLESESFQIPVTSDKVVAINATCSVVSATEGATITKDSISSIQFTYLSGKIETLTQKELDLSKLTITGEIIANTSNTIKVTYDGVSTTINIFGIPDSIVSIEGTYVGSGIEVGSIVTNNDLVIKSKDRNGTITTLDTSSYIIENATIYNVGKNTVIVHYGSLECEVVVTGIPKSTEIPTIAPTNIIAATEIPTIAPTNTITEIPEVTLAPTAISPAPDVLEPETPGSNVTVEEVKPITISTNVSGVKLSEKSTYTTKTNKNLTVKIVTSAAIEKVEYQLVTKGKKLGSTWKVVSNNKVTVKNTTNKYQILYLRYTNIDGTKETVHTTGFMIDKTKPKANIKKNKTYKKGKKITFKDNQSGIKTAKLDGKIIKSGKVVTKKGKHTLMLTDKAGNKISIAFKIK